MVKIELAERMAATIRDLDELEKERKAVLDAFKQRKEVLRNDLRSFCEDVVQMRLEEMEAE